LAFLDPLSPDDLREIIDHVDELRFGSQAE
jgi:hypothetical protein